MFMCVCACVFVCIHSPSLWQPQSGPQDFLQRKPQAQCTLHSCHDSHYMSLGANPASVLKNLPANAGDADSIARLGKSARKGNGSPLQYSCLGSPTEEVWWATVHGVAKKSQILLNDQTTVTTSSVPGSAGFHFLRPILRIVAAYAWLQSGHHIVNFSTWWEFQ